MKKILYVDLDGVVVDFEGTLNLIPESVRFEFKDRFDDIPNIFSLMKPIKGSIENIKKLSNLYNIYFLTTAPWENPSAWSDKLIWVKNQIGEIAYKRLIITHHKELNIGDFLIDDRENNGAKDFKGELILFGSEKFPDWQTVSKYLQV